MLAPGMVTNGHAAVPYLPPVAFEHAAELPPGWEMVGLSEKFPGNVGLVPSGHVIAAPLYPCSPANLLPLSAKRWDSQRLPTPERPKACWNFSKSAKKKVLSFLIGPPMLPPH